MIYDRTRADVDTANQIIAKINRGETLTAAEKALYSAGLKGRYNYTDLNRVETKTAELVSLMQGCGYHIELAVKTNWKQSDTIRRADIERYLGNIATLRRILPEVMAPPAVPISRWLDYAAANDIERTLWAVESALDGITQYLRRCGTFAAGGSYAAQIIRRA